MKDGYLNTREAARRLGVSTTSILKWIDRGLLAAIPPLRRGKLPGGARSEWQIDAESVERLRAQIDAGEFRPHQTQDRGEALRLRTQGKTLEEIAQAIGITSREGARRKVNAALRELAEKPNVRISLEGVAVEKTLQKHHVLKVVPGMSVTLLGNVECRRVELLGGRWNPGEFRVFARDGIKQLGRAA